MTTYAVTGASGQLGRLAVQELLALGVPTSDVIAVVRSPGKVADLAARGVQVRPADYGDPQSLTAALKDIDRLLLISTSFADTAPGQRLVHHRNVIDAAKAAGVGRIAYTSILNADHSTSPLAGEHRETERVLRESGIAFTLLRNGYYWENYTGLGGEIVGANGSGRVSVATRRDYAAAAAAALHQDEPGNRTYELGGPSFDLPELARALSEETGTPVTYTDLPPDEYARKSGDFLAALDASVARGDLETTSHDLEHLLGHPATPRTSTTVVAVSTMQPKPGRRPALIALLAELAQQIHAEPGCRHYSVHRAFGDDDGPLLVIQSCTTIEAFREHSKRIQAQIPRLAALVATPPAPPSVFVPIPLGGDDTKQSLR